MSASGFADGLRSLVLPLSFIYLSLTLSRGTSDEGRKAPPSPFAWVTSGMLGFKDPSTERGTMPTYISLIRWTDQGRKVASSLPDRVGQVEKRIEQLGGKQIGNWLTMGRFDQIAVVEAPDDETAAKMLMIVAERGNASTETLRAFTMDEVRSLQA
jgi:uncharacterized protein with GYD domain